MSCYGTSQIERHGTGGIPAESKLEVHLSTPSCYTLLLSHDLLLCSSHVQLHSGLDCYILTIVPLGAAAVAFHHSDVMLNCSCEGVLEGAA